MSIFGCRRLGSVRKSLLRTAIYLSFKSRGGDGESGGLLIHAKEKNLMDVAVRYRGVKETCKR